MKKVHITRFLISFFAFLAVCLVAAVSIVGLSGFSGIASVKALPAAPSAFTFTQLGLGQGDCFYTGSFDVKDNPSGVPLVYTNNRVVKSCVGLNPPPMSNCNPKAITHSTLDVNHETRDEIDIGGYAKFDLLYNPSCGSGWDAINVYAGCHDVSQISVMDSFLGHTAHGIDVNGKLVCARGWESSQMVDAESGSTLSANVTIDFSTQQSAAVTI